MRLKKKRKQKVCQANDRDSLFWLGGLNEVIVSHDLSMSENTDHFLIQNILNSVIPISFTVEHIVF